MASGVVLVTGASTGSGEATAFHLRELGFDPVAGVRRRNASTAAWPWESEGRP
jgi:NAD(P)-dependent dehydrogenase (short-subunit alcohol dehydrogenase family)